EAEEATAVVDDQQQAGTAQIVGEDHLAAMDGAHRFTLARGDVDALPAQRAVAALAAEAIDRLAGHRPRQLSAQLAEGLAIADHRAGGGDVETAALALARGFRGGLLLLLLLLLLLALLALGFGDARLLGQF